MQFLIGSPRLLESFFQSSLLFVAGLNYWFVSEVVIWEFAFIARAEDGFGSDSQLGPRQILQNVAMILTISYIQC